MNRLLACLPCLLHLRDTRDNLVTLLMPLACNALLVVAFNNWGFVVAYANLYILNTRTQS